MHRDAVRRWLEQTGEQLRFHIHPHVLRHTFCTRLLKNGVDIATVSKLAGHANLNTTVKQYHQYFESRKGEDRMWQQIVVAIATAAVTAIAKKSLRRDKDAHV